MIRKSNTSSGAYLLKRAAQLARSIVAAYGIKTEIFDGFLVRGRRIGTRHAAEVYDPPAWLVVIGTLQDAAPTDIADSLLLEVPLGRDGLLRNLAHNVVQPADSLLTVRPLGTIRLGVDDQLTFSHPLRTAETCYPVATIGTLRGFDRLFASQGFAVNAPAFVDRTAQVRYQALMLVPQLVRSQFAESGGSWSRSDVAIEDALSGLTLLLGDSLLRDRGALPFCMRQNPPAYDPTSTAATTFTWAQAPWQDFVAERYRTDEGVDTYRVTLWVHAVFDMRLDSDAFGARGLWVGTFIVDVQAGTAELAQDFVIDTRGDDNVLRRPRLSGTAYLYNAHLRVGGELLDSGTAVIVDAFQVAADGGTDPGSVGAVRRYMSLDLLWVSRQGQLARRQTILDAFNVNTGPHDMRAPVGIATDGAEVLVFAFTTAFTNQPSNLDIIVATESGASVVYSEDVPFYQCLGVSSGSNYSTGYDQNQHWQAVGAGGNQACYIGNGKYLFHVSSVVSVTGIASGNIAAAVYDRATNSVEVVGVLDATITSVLSSLLMGRPCCLQEETDDRKATIIATRGGVAVQVAGAPGVEGGTTWVSHDSGVTWQEVVQYGSPAGVAPTGNIFQARQT